MAIRYDKALNAQIRRTVRNYNRRVAKMKAEEKDLDIDFVTVSDLKKQFGSRRNLLHELKRLESIRGDSSSIARAALRERTRAKIKETYAIKRLEAEKGTSEFTPLKANALASHEAKRQALNKNYSSLQGKEKTMYNKLVKSITQPNPKRLETFYDNFFDMLFTDVYHSDLYGEKAGYIREQLSKLTPEQLLAAYNEKGVIHDIVEGYHAYVATHPTDANEFGSFDPALNAYINNLYDSVDSIVKEYSKR